MFAKHSMNFPVLDLKNTGNIFGAFGLDIVRERTGARLTLFGVDEALLVMFDFQVETVEYGRGCKVGGQIIG